MRRFTLAAAVLLICGRVGASGAQRVSGRAVESAASTPVAGAVITLLDAAGRTVARTVSNAAGEFQLSGNGRAVSLGAIHIGFRPAAKVLAAASGDSVVVVNVLLDRLPDVLEAVVVHDQSRCPAATNASAAFALWDDARNALLATVVAREVDAPTVRVVSYARQLDANGKHVDQQVVTDSIYVASRPLVAARSAEEFASRGYRESGANRDNRTYYAPDADVLLDSTFLLTHCLSLLDKDHDHPTDVGIAFAPRPGRDSLVDIAGVLWLNRAAAELRSLDFNFTSSNAADAGSGGALVFTMMPTGITMISSWKLHLPIVRVEIGRFGAGPQGPVRIVGFRDTGGELAEAGWRDGSSWLGRLGTISGSVASEAGRSRLSGATVRLKGTRIQTHTDSGGAFILPSVVPGSYVIEAEDDVMAQLGTPSMTSESIVLERAAIDGIHLELPSRSTAIAAFCEAANHRSRSSALGDNLLIGNVRFVNGAATSDAFVRANWVDVASSAAASIQFGGRSDSSGTFVLCGAPAGVRLTLSAVRDSLVSVDATVTIDPLQHIAYANLVLEAPSVSLPAHRRRQLRITDDVSQAPLVGVEVDDATTDRLIGFSPANGTVSLASLPPGRSLLRVRRIGYEQRTVVVDVEPDDSLPVLLALRTVTQIAAVKVTAAASAATSRLAFESGFEDRAAMGLGHFLRAADFYRYGADRLANVLQHIGVKQAMSGRTGTILLGGHGLPCPVTIYIDDALFYTARWARVGIAPPDVSSMFGVDFAAAEYYASGADIPPQYNGTDSDCGVLLLWRKY